MPVGPFQTILSKFVAAYPVHLRGSWQMRKLASPYLVAEVDRGLWMRISGLVAPEWEWLQGQGKEPETAAFLNAYLRPGMSVVDVGANVGYFTILAAQRVQKQGCVVSFEPTPEIAARLRENIALNRFDWVEAIEAAVVGTPTPLLQLYGSPEGDAEGNSVYNAGKAAAVYTVKGVTLDECMLSRNRPVNFIKIDAEGAEPEVLRGAAGLLQRDKPDLLIEINPLQLETSRSSPDVVFGLLEQFHYRWRNIESFEWRGLNVSNIFASPVEPRPDFGADNKA